VDGPATGTVACCACHWNSKVIYLTLFHTTTHCYRRRLNSICPTMYITGWLTSSRGTPTVLFMQATLRARRRLEPISSMDLTDVGLHTVFRSVVVAKLLYACSAWSGFITASDRHRVDAFLHRSKRSGYCQPDLPSFDELVEDSDDRLFNKLCNNTGHSLHYLLPPPSLAS